MPGLFAVPIFSECLGAHRDDPGEVRQRLDVVHHRRALVEPAHREPRRAVARVALPALERGEEPGGLAADVRASAAMRDQVEREVRPHDPLAEEPGVVGLVDRAGEAPVGQVELAADVDERVPHLQRVGGDRHRLDEEVRGVLENPAVLEGARLALVGVGAQVVRLTVVEVHDLPLAAGGERGAAVAEDARRGDLLGYLLGLHRAQDHVQRAVAAARAVVGERVRRRRHRERHQELAAGHYSRPSSSRSTFSALMSS